MFWWHELHENWFYREGEGIILQVPMKYTEDIYPTSGQVVMDGKETPIPL